MTPHEKPPMGRPTKYDPSFCEMVVATLAEGGSLSTFAAQIGVARSSLNVWMTDHPDFLDACARAKTAAAAYWEARANKVGLVGGGPGTAQVIMFALRNFAPEDWSADRRTKLKLPSIDSAKSAMAAIAEAMAAFARGEIDAPHAESIVSMARNYIGAAEVADIEARLAALEQQGKP